MEKFILQQDKLYLKEIFDGGVVFTGMLSLALKFDTVNSADLFRKMYCLEDFKIYKIKCF